MLDTWFFGTMDDITEARNDSDDERLAEVVSTGGLLACGGEMHCNLLGLTTDIRD